MSDHIDTIREALEIGEVAARTKHLPPLVFKRSLDALAALESAIALDPLRQPVAGDRVEAGRMAYHDWCREHDKRDPWPYTKAIEACIAAADRARGFAGTAGGEWRQIDSAPMDGVTEVDLWASGRRETDCHWHLGEWITWKSDSVDDEPHWQQIENPIAWFPKLSPPAWATQSPERRSDSAPRDAAADTTTHGPGVAALAGGVETVGYKGQRVWRSRVAACGRKDCSMQLMCGDPYKCGAELVPSLGFISKDKFYPAPIRQTPITAPGHTDLPDEAEAVSKESLPTEPPPFPPWSAEMATLLDRLAIEVTQMLRDRVFLHQADEILAIKNAAFPETK